jgi:hypothetical protein
MKKTIIILFAISANVLFGQNYNISFSVDSLKKCKESLEYQLNDTKNIISDLESVYSRWKLNKKADIFYYVNCNCSVSDGLQDFYTDSNNLLNIKKGTKVIVVKVTPNSYKIFNDGKEYFIQTKNLTRQEEYLKEDNNIVLNKLKDSLNQQITKIETLELSEKRLKTRKKYQLKKDSINQQLTVINYKLGHSDVADYYIVTKESGIYLPYDGIYYRESDYVKNLQVGTKVRVARYLSSAYAYRIILNGKDYVIKQGCVLPETEYILSSIINSNTIVKDSLFQEINEIETKLASSGFGEVYYFDEDCDLYTGQNARYRGGGNYEMTVPTGTKIVVVGDGYYTNEVVLNGKRYWVASSCLVPEKEYLSELKKNQELRLKDSLAFANPTPHYFKKDGWLCDSLDVAEMFCIGDTINVKKGTKVFFVKNIGSTVYPRSIVFYNDKLFYTATTFLVSEKSILENNKWRKEQEELSVEQNKQRQEYQRKRVTNLENKYGSKIAQDIINGLIWIGMTDEMAKESLGEPSKINRTVTTYLVSEQWVYNSRVYLYFENGILTAWQD